MEPCLLMTKACRKRRNALRLSKGAFKRALGKFMKEGTVYWGGGWSLFKE